jgi:hypothetical protein
MRVTLTDTLLARPRFARALLTPAAGRRRASSAV